MSVHRKHTREQILKAIKDSGAIKLTVCKRLRCSHHTFDAYLRDLAYVREAWEAERNFTDDFVESKLLELVRKGNVAAIIFYCKTKLRSRGYAEKLQIEPPDADQLPRIIDDVPDIPPPKVIEEGDVIDIQESPAAPSEEEV